MSDAPRRGTFESENQTMVPPRLSYDCNIRRLVPLGTTTWFRGRPQPWKVQRTAAKSSRGSLSPQATFQAIGELLTRPYLLLIKAKSGSNKSSSGDAPRSVCLTP